MTKTEFKQEVFTFLDNLRESGKINMFGAAPVVEEAYGLSRQDAREITTEWMDKFDPNGTTV